ncbi:hypothetical protein ACE1TF_00355 [Geomicrobium sp. JSM 1781026]|uniref:hypothetical protein n=1 Tax=unclassified Geomicrobium TaxID=2628951 RepID=UPI0012692DFD|nr:hypothetical protein [Geomicrobium sp. JCM 19037]
MWLLESLRLNTVRKPNIECNICGKNIKHRYLKLGTRRGCYYCLLKFLNHTKFDNYRLRVVNKPADPGVDTVQLMADLRFIIQKRSIAGLVRDERNKENDDDLYEIVESFKSE